MIELIVKGNKKSFQLKRIYEYIEIKLRGNFDFNANSKIDFIYDNVTYYFADRNQLFKFAEEARGGNLDKIILLFRKYDFDSSFVNNLSNKKVIEIGLLKALFLIFYWIELILTNPDRSSIKTKIYNEFVLDLNDNIGSQNDIYLIDERYIIENNETLLNTLMELNLLASLNIRFPQENLTSYFIPLIKPGVPKELFKRDSDPDGNNAYTLWKKILKDRDSRIKYWINNRY